MWGLPRCPKAELDWLPAFDAVTDVNFDIVGGEGGGRRRSRDLDKMIETAPFEDMRHSISPWRKRSASSLCLGFGGRLLLAGQLGGNEATLSLSPPLEIYRCEVALQFLSSAGGRSLTVRYLHTVIREFFGRLVLGVFVGSEPFKGAVLCCCCCCY